MESFKNVAFIKIEHTQKSSKGHLKYGFAVSKNT